MSDLPESQPPAVFRSRRRLRTLAWHGLRFQARWLWRLSLLVVFLVAAVVLGLRYWLLPRIDEYRPRLVAELSQALGAPVTLGPLHADWQGLRPTLELSDLVVSDRSGHPAIRLARLNASLSLARKYRPPVFWAISCSSGSSIRTGSSS